MGNAVWVLSAAGWVQHGAVRASAAQAARVAASLSRRLGWVCCVSVGAPAAVAVPVGAPPVALAGLSPVWKDAGLAARWAAAGRGAAPAPAPLPAAPVAEPLVVLAGAPRLSRGGVVLVG